MPLCRGDIHLKEVKAIIQGSQHIREYTNRTPQVHTELHRYKQD